MNRKLLSVLILSVCAALYGESAGTAPVQTEETGVVFYDGFEGSTKGKNGAEKHLFAFVPKGQKGQGLHVRNQSFWILPDKFDFASGEFTVDFDYKPVRKVLPGERKAVWDIVRGHFGRNRGFWLYFDRNTGKMKLQISQTDANGKVLDWTNGASSKTDKWEAGKWLHVKLIFEKSAIRLMVDDQEELTVPVKFAKSPLKNLQFGRPYVSMGHYDELKISDGKK